MYIWSKYGDIYYKRLWELSFTVEKLSVSLAPAPPYYVCGSIVLRTTRCFNIFFLLLTDRYILCTEYMELTLDGLGCALRSLKITFWGQVRSMGLENIQNTMHGRSRSWWSLRHSPSSSLLPFSSVFLFSCWQNGHVKRLGVESWSWVRADCLGGRGYMKVKEKGETVGVHPMFQR